MRPEEFQELPEGFKVWADADSLSPSVRKVILRATRKYGFQTIFVANRSIEGGENTPGFLMVVCPPSEGAADDFIASRCDANSLVITRDLPFAKRVMDMGVPVMNDRGTLFDERKLARMLEERELHLQMTALGLSKSAKTSSGLNGEMVHKFTDTFYGFLRQKGLA